METGSHKGFFTLGFRHQSPGSTASMNASRVESLLRLHSFKSIGETRVYFKDGKPEKKNKPPSMLALHMGHIATIFTN